MSAKWYVLNTVPRAEYLAAYELDRDGYEVFLPCVKITNSRAGHTDTPIFPGYLFIRRDYETEGWPTFRSAHRVLGWLKFGDEVPWLPDEVVSDLRGRIEAVNEGGGIWHQFQYGDRVEIVSKTMQTLGEVIDTSPSAHGRVKVLIDFMGRQVPAQVPWDLLRPLSATVKANPPAPRRTRGNRRWIHGYGSRMSAASIEANTETQ